MASQVEHEFVNVVNRHGYAFQFAVLQRAKQLYEESKSPFRFEVSEFPVQVRGAHTRIDFILKKREGKLLLISECKRANPALSNWCFVRAPFVRGNRSVERPMIDRLRRDRGEIFYVEPVIAAMTDRAYHIGFEVKSQAKGDAVSARATIEEAATQVSRGLNGLIEFYLRDVSLLKDMDELWFLPVVFTTANLLSSEADLTQTNISSGEIALSATTLKEEWLLYQYHVSPGIKHETRYRATSADLGEALDREFVRTIAIVSPNGIEPFLRWASGLWFDKLN
ncbi:MAG TPA: hypothetical protein VGQ65_16825 [Thermoanaerobaculia bacterium]|jgi:hypothetical protein|nr:hypothetical protein [Thermoanaerobaculia bacterium]